MPLCVFVSLEDSTGHILDDELCRPYFQAEGWTLEEWAWSQSHQWGDADLVVFRSCYDYWQNLEEFQLFLSRLEQTNCSLVNSPELIRWNCDKRYLFQLENLGIEIVPSDYLAPGAPSSILQTILGRHPAVEKFVVKPCVGAGGHEMRVLTRVELATLTVTVPSLVQPFQDEVYSGEWSLMVFGQTVSHAVRKIAAPGDYRVQDTHGGTTVSVSLLEHPELEVAVTETSAAIAKLDLPPAVYARYDFLLQSESEKPQLMEVELIEPSLFLQHSPQAAELFTKNLLEQHYLLQGGNGS